MPNNPPVREDYLEGVRRDEVVWVGHTGLNLRYLLYVPLHPRPTRSLLVIGKNPSAATAKQSDQTVNQITRYVQKSGKIEGVEQIIVANLYAYYGTDSGILVTKLDKLGDAKVVGPRNDEFIAEAASKAERIIVAWGGKPDGASKAWSDEYYDPRVRAVLELLPPEKLWCVRRKQTKPLEGDLHPFHPRNWSAKLDSVCVYKTPRP